MRELRYIHCQDNDFNGSISNYNRHYYSFSMNDSNNIHHYQQQVQFKRSSSRIRQQTHTNLCQRQLLRSHRHPQQNSNQNITNKVRISVFVFGRRKFC